MNINDWLDQNTIFEAISGSQAYGLSTPESDTDYRGVCIAPIERYLGLPPSFEQHETKDPDRVIFDIRKFTRLAAEANPNIIELLFMPEDMVVRTTPSWGLLSEIREAFLSEKCRHSYSGYAFSQIHRVKTHRRWLLSPPDHAPTRGEFGLPEESKMPAETMGMIESVARSTAETACARFPGLADQHETIAECALDTIAGLSSDLFSGETADLYFRERKYRGAKREWDQYNTWLANRNPKRAEMEKKFGFDGKHMSHVFRLLHQGEEIVSKGTLSVRLSPEHAEECRAIRAGAHGYDDLLERAGGAMSRIKGIPSVVPRTPDRAKIEERLVRIISEFHTGAAPSR